VPTQSAIHDPQSAINVAGIVLCGGRSSRMGLAKLALPFGPELMLQRVVRLLSEAVSPVVVVAAPGQELPPLPAGVLLTNDEREGRGPLEGLLAGLTAIAPRADAAYVTSCDVPLFVPGFARQMIERLGDCEIAVPVDGELAHPLAGVYRTSVLPHIRALLAADQRRLASLFDRARTCRVPIDDLQAVDPQLSTLQNLNQPEDYLAALAAAGFPPDPATVAALERPRT
jgi:molybdopterin-guanine dinucleotide biosynthesis protein A